MMRASWIAAILCMCWAGPVLAAPELWQALRSGAAVAVMRHAEAPGTGDPAGFRLDDCTSQRNLSAAGREQAARLGERFRSNDIAVAEIRSSAWCRCRDTATALGLGPVQTDGALNSFFETPAAATESTAALRRLIAALPAGKPAVLVTHQVNITALAGIYPRSGEMVVLRRDDLTVLGRLPAD